MVFFGVGYWDMSLHFLFLRRKVYLFLVNIYGLISVSIIVLN